MLRRFIVLMCCCFITATVFSGEEEFQESFSLSTPDQLATLTSEPSYLVGGLISPLSGQPALRQTDLVVKGAQNITLTRTYIPPYIPCAFPKQKYARKESERSFDRKFLHEHLKQNYKGWQFFPHVRLRLNPKTNELRLTEPSGATLDFKISGSEAHLSSPSYAMTNLLGDEPSGKYDLRNTRISIEDNEKTFIVHASDGSMRYYQRRGVVEKNYFLCFLRKEVLPNGKILKYQYNEKWQPAYVESLDPQERYVYASLRITGSPVVEGCRFTSSSGVTADYGYTRRHEEVEVKQKFKKGHTRGTISFLNPPLLTSVSSPFFRDEKLSYCDRFLLTQYTGKEHLFTSQHAGFGNPSDYRIHKLSLPVGENDDYKPVYELTYESPVAGERGGVTRVKNSDGTSTLYHFSKNLLTTSIQYFDQAGALKKEKIFTWDDHQWLSSLEIRDGQKTVLYRKSYEYDRFGNPTVEVFSGDLTGEGTTQSDTILREFSGEGRNLLMREEHENGKVVCFSYLPGTNLITSKLTKEKDLIVQREFQSYDDCHNLIQKIIDDGTTEEKGDLSNLSQRRTTNYLLRSSAPFLHLPEWIEEKYWEGGKEKLLKKSHLIYDEHGNSAEEEVYDAEGKLAYTLYKTYNERGDLLTETNPLGHEACYSYDARGHLTTSTSFSNRLQQTFHYDTKGRLSKRVESGDEGTLHTTSAAYDFHDRKVTKTDLFQNTTHYTYDPLVSEISSTQFPPILSLEGSPTSVATSSTYDPFGRELTHTDANGHTTTYRYNAYGSPTEIIYPEGSCESFRYTKKGALTSHTDSDGLTVTYTRDLFDRILTTTYVSKEGIELAQEQFSYTPFNLLSETDKEGNLTRYFYDGAGRKIRENVRGRVTDFSYDALGWLAQSCKYNGNNTLVTHYTRDLEGRILEEQKTDLSGNLLYKVAYSYDAEGDQTTVTRSIQGKEAVDTFTYDPFRRVIRHLDGEGYLTQTIYNEEFTNLLGQKTLQTITIDPRAISSIETQDALARVVKKEILSPNGEILSCQEMTHDPQGNLLYQRDHLYQGENFQGIQTIAYTYTPTNKIATLTRGYGTSDPRTTTYTYLPSEKLATTTLPNGVTLLYAYDAFGYKSRLDSSDGSIHHAFEYNLLGSLKTAYDENQNSALHRECDRFGNVTSEHFPCGLEVIKTYDDSNRLTSLKMASQGEVIYTYDPLYLKEVTRSLNGKKLYSHLYEEYDLNGNLLTESLIGNQGRVFHALDLRGLKTSLSCPHFSEECGYDAASNLVSHLTDGVACHYSYDGLSQLSSENSSAQTQTYLHDSLHNRTQKNGNFHQINSLNELVSSEECSCEYDLNGNLVFKKTPSETLHFSYDPLNQLIAVTSENRRIDFVYDPLGRRLSKVVTELTKKGWKEISHENYLYHGQNEIGAFTPEETAKNLRVLGLAKHKNSPTTIGVELEGKRYAPLFDVQGNIRRLVALKTGAIAGRYDFTAFGEPLSSSISSTPFNPWGFASKRLDPELGLIYFGKRYYDPHLGRWVTTDPAGFIDSANLYQYVLNNPFRYVDPDGQFAFLLPLLIPFLEIAIPTLAISIPAFTAANIAIAAGAVIIGGAGYELSKAINQSDDREYRRLHKNTDVYAPDRPLPLDEDGVPIPDTEAPHTQLGTRGSKRRPGERYPQAREFDENGRPVKSIDFTDHGEPGIHSNPHEHPNEPNPTGGTPKRGDPKPLENWKY